MGAGSSVNFQDLSSIEKAEITKAVEQEYKTNSTDTKNDVELFEKLKHAFEEKQQELILNRAKKIQKLPHVSFNSEPQIELYNEASMKFNPTGNSVKVTPDFDGLVPDESSGSSTPLIGRTLSAATEDEGDQFEFALRASFDGNNSAFRNRTISKIEKNDGPQKLLKAKTSSQLLSLINDSVLEDHNKIADFISQLKLGEVETKESQFRQRRLTYSQQAMNKDDPPPARVSPTKREFKNRTTIFASSEIGMVQEKKAPFPDTILGTYSCHGIEPSNNGIHEKINQDRGCIVYPYNNKRNEALYMVLDGHGPDGDKVSEFVMRQIVISLEKDPLLATDPETALKNAYITTNTALQLTDIHFMTSGCTCVTIYCRDNRMYVANVGDSRAVMAYKDGDAYIAKQITRDHKPDDPEEQARIESWGGFVCPPHEEGLSARVYLDKEFTMIGLAMSRSIGDHAVKKVGVIPEPEVTIYDVQGEDQFLIMASDGVWEFISCQEAVEIVQSVIDDGVHDACQELIENAAMRWQEEEGDYRDDITAIVMRMPLPYSQA